MSRWQNTGRVWFIKSDGDTMIGFECPGCNMAHVVRIETDHPKRIKWDFNGDPDFPTLTPSISRKWTEGEQHKPSVCHFQVTNGEIKFYEDSTHEFSGRTAPLKEYV